MQVGRNILETAEERRLCWYVHVVELQTNEFIIIDITAECRPEVCPSSVATSSNSPPHLPTCLLRSSNQNYKFKSKKEEEENLENVLWMERRLMEVVPWIITCVPVEIEDCNEGRKIIL